MTEEVARAADEGRPWLASYPPGVPEAIDVEALRSIPDMLRRSVAEHGERPAYESFGVSLTYAELMRAAEAVASWLQARGVGRGDRVAIMLPNVMAYPAILYGVLVAGGTVVNVNPLYTPRELSHQLRDAGAKHLFVLENFAHTVEAAWPELGLDTVVVARPGDLIGLKGVAVSLVSRYVRRAVRPYRLPGAVPFRQVLAEGGARALDPVEVRPDDVAFLQYTGGTTGVAKGAVLLHRNVAANVEQCAAWFGAELTRQPGGRPPVMVTALPLYHIFALTCCALLMMRAGACCLLIANPRDIPGFVKTLKARRFTMMSGVNTLYNALSLHPGLAEVDFSQLTVCVAGGMATQKPVARRWQEITGRPIVEGYGLSETSPVICINRVDIDGFTGTIGYPLPSTEIAIRTLDGAAVRPGEAGELVVRGPQVMAGYWQRPDETRLATTEDGFLRTGDAALLLPDGQVRIVDRIKDMVLVSGFNVYPNEVEEVLVRHPGVAEAAVIGVAEEGGETVVAFVVRRDPALTEAALRAHARAGLTSYKVPRRIEFRDSLPKTNVGKVLRRALRDEAPGGDAPA